MGSQRKGFKLDSIFDPNSYKTVADGPTSSVERAHYPRTQAGIPLEWVAIKSASPFRAFLKQPRDIIKELRFLCSIYHVNVIEVLGYTFDRLTYTHNFWMPYIPHDLSAVLSSPAFSPHPAPDLTSDAQHDDAEKSSSFVLLTKSLMYQLLSAIAYVHDQQIAHRDIKPRNVLIAADGCVKLIDFDVAWSENVDGHELWPEPAGELCFDVATGPYRAPELLFGATDYDAFATDLWSLGATLAGFFTPLKLVSECEWDDEDDEGFASDSDEEEESSKQPFIIPKSLNRDWDPCWKRESLFDSSKGSIGLAWSIFQIRGTPTEEDWPTFKDLPYADQVTFQLVPPVEIQTLLPNLPANWPPSIPESPVPAPDCFTDLIDRFLTYTPSLRLGAPAALQHAIFTQGCPILLPTEYPTQNNIHCTYLWENKQLGDLLLDTLRSTRQSEIH